MQVAPHVAELRELLGPDVLLLSWAWGTKAGKRLWGHLTTEEMKKPAYLMKLGRGNIGVAQGRVSGGLCSLDIDNDDEMEQFLALNPEIGKTLRSRGSRGCNFWWMVADDDYPPLTPLKRYGKGWGEWRSTGAQTIIYGRHPDGHNYQIINRVKPVTIKMIQIRWPEGIYPLLQGGIMTNDSKNLKTTALGLNRTDATQETHAAHANNAKDAANETKATKEISETLDTHSMLSFPEVLISKAVPKDSHENHNLLFDLAREVRTFEEQNNRRYQPEELREIFDRWHCKAKPFLRVDQPEDDYFMEFMKAYLRVKFLIGQQVFHEAMNRARNAEPVKEVMAVVKQPGIRLLAALCRELQRLWGVEPFFLSCRMIEKEFQVSPSTASLWLNGLEGCRVIKTVVKGNQKTMQASRFLYLLPL